MGWWTLERRMRLSFLGIALTSTFFALLFYSIEVKRSISQQLAADGQRNLQHAMSQVELQTLQISDLSNWISHNEDILALLARPAETANAYNLQFHNVVSELDRQLSYRPVSRYLQSLFLCGANGLDIRNGSESALVPAETVTRLIQNTGYDTTHWGGRIENTALFTQERYVIPYCCPIRDNAGEPLGWVIALFSEGLFSSQYNGLLPRSPDQACLYNGRGELLCGTVPDPSRRELLLSCDSPSNGWRMELRPAETAAMQQRRTLISTACFFSALLLGLASLVGLQLTRILTAPIVRIIAYVHQISAGRFAAHPRRPTKTELDELENSIADMADSIQRLMAQEQERQQLEIRVLQAQMNPHFLYNTLNVIRLMATMQGKKSISSMIDALSHILHANLSLRASTIPLEQELALLESYMYIQNISQKGRLQWRFDGVPADLRSQLVPKFLLQPLVENAITHGFSDTAGGCIEITGTREKDRLLLAVHDNGCGIPPERLAALNDALRNPPGEDHAVGEPSSPFEISQAVPSHGVALQNVQRRIRLHYGERYGLQIGSPQNDGCTVRISLPYADPKEELICSMES